MRFWVTLNTAIAGCFLLVTALAPAQSWRQEQVSANGGTRTYWHIQINQFEDFMKSNGGAYVCTTGLVTEVHKEADGDQHIVLEINQPKSVNGKTPLGFAQHKVVLEVVPEYPLNLPKKGWIVEGCGIHRPDAKHRWYELHPLLRWKQLT